MSYRLLTKGKLLWFVDCAALTLWLCCLLRFAILLPLVGTRFLPQGIADFFHVVAVIPVAELVVVRLVRRNWSQGKYGSWPVVANALRMVWLCYGVIFVYPKIAKHILYSVLIGLWCLGYLVHFAYYAFKVKFRTTPYFLFWLKHHIMFVTFPALVVAEMVLLFLSLKFAEDGTVYEWFIKAVLVGYVPLGYFAWGYLLDRRQEKYYDVLVKKEEYRRNIAMQNLAPPAAVLANTAPLNTRRLPLSQEVTVDDLPENNTTN